MYTKLLNTPFFDKKQKWYLTHGLYLPLISVVLSYYFGQFNIKYIKQIKNLGIRSLLVGLLIGGICYIVSLFFTIFPFMKIITNNEIINNSILCGILSAESMMFVGEHTHLEIQKIFLFLFLYFHNLNL